MNGGAGNDVLNVTVLGTSGGNFGQLSSVETINVRDVFGSGANNYNALLASGVTAINVTGTLAGNTSTISNVAALSTTLGLAGKGNLTATYAPGIAAGTADAANVAITDVGSKDSAGTITRSTVDVSNSNTIETVNVAASGTNYLTLTGGTAVTSVVVTGAGAVDITGTALVGDATNAKLTYDASASTGKQTVTFGAGAITVKGGSADDTFAFGSTLGSTDSIDTGAGNDKLTFTIGTAVQALPTVANAEALEATFSAAGTLNASKVTGATSLTFKGSSASAVTNLAQGTTSLVYNDNNHTAGSSVGYATGASSDVVATIGHINTAANGTGSGFSVGGLTLSGNAGTLTVNSVVDSDNTSAVTNQTGALDAGTATKLTLNSAKFANLTVGAITAGSVTDLTANATTGALQTGALATADKLAKLTLTSTGDANITTGAIGGTAAASALTDVVVNVAAKAGTTGATVNLGNITATKNATATAVAVSGLKNVDITLGGGLTITALPAIAGVDGNGGGNANIAAEGAGVAQLTRYNLTVGADTAVGSGSISARSITSSTISTTDSAAATAIGQTLTVDESLGSLTLTAGKNVTLTATVNGIDDAEATDVYNLAIGTITASGTGNVAVAGLSTGVKSIAGIDLSGVSGTSQVAASSLSGTAGVEIKIGSGGTTATGVSGSDKADIITGGAKADTILGGAGADQITGGLGADVITGGAGTDTIDLTEATSSADTIRYAESGAGNVDSVTGFKAGTDIVSFDKTDASFGGVALASAGGTDVSAAGAATAATIAVNTSGAVADAANLLFFSNTSATSFAAAIGTATITDTTGLNWSNNTGVAAVYYDANNGQAVFGYVQDTTAAGIALTSADTFVEVVRVGMTASDYTSANITASFSFF